jgi:hypothetical protein
MTGALSAIIALQGLAELQRLVTDGIASGVSSRSMDEVLKIARQQATCG